MWKKNNQLHRLDAPAYISADYTTEEWYQIIGGKSMLHRLDGPAILRHASAHNGYQSVPYTICKWYYCGQLHRLDGPACTSYDKESWYQIIDGESKLHREDGPAVTDSQGTEWYVNGLKHRLDGPAVDTKYRKEWWVNGVLHRLDGPAVVYIEGTYQHVYNMIPRKHIAWFVDGKPHREDGPAFEYYCGTQKWFIEGVLIKKIKRCTRQPCHFCNRVY